jgi:hypothetical protein
MPNIYFYIHPYFWPKRDVPDNPDIDWPGFGFGIYTWTIQTYLRLIQSGFECQLVSSIPSEGILIAHRECLSSMNGAFSEEVKPSKRLYVVNISADQSLYAHANLNIVQSCYQSKNYKNCNYVPHWPQPGLIKRDPARGRKFQNIAFLGNIKNLAPEFKTSQWCEEVKKLNLNFVLMDQKFSFDNPESYCTTGIWNDYSEIDAIVAVRQFNVRPYLCALNKPASKLYNAWLAGVPAIIGRDYQCHEERRGDHDYLEVDTIDEVLIALRQLKEDFRLRELIVENGFTRAEEIKADVTVEKWKSLIIEKILPDYENWTRKTVSVQKLTITKNIFISDIQRFSNKAQRMLNFNLRN